MNWASITIIVLVSLEMGYIMARHGEQRQGKHSMYKSLVMALLFAFLIYMSGGFK